MYRDVTPRLAIDESYPDALPPRNAANLITSGCRVIVGTDDDAVATLVLLGVEKARARWQVGCANGVVANFNG